MRFTILASFLVFAAAPALAEEPPATPVPPAQAQATPAPQAPAAPVPAADAALRLDLARQIVALRSQGSEMQLFRAKLPWYTAAMRANVRLSDEQRAALPRVLEEQFRAAMIPAHENIAATYARIFTADQLRDVLTFNTSATGRAWLSHQDEITETSLTLQRVVDLAVLSGATQALQAPGAAQQ
jgi:hypothetical protein